MSSSPRIGLFLSLLLALLPAAIEASSYATGPVPAEEQIDVRALPSLLTEWSWRGTVDEWRLEDGVVYLVGGGRLAAIEAGGGDALWSYELAQDCTCSKLEVLPDRVVAGIDGRAILVDRASGGLAADRPLGKVVSKLLADPLILVYEDAFEAAHVVRLDEVSGTELARFAPKGSVSTVVREGDRLVVAESAEGGRKTLVGLDLSLQELWRRALPPQAWVRSEGDRILVESWGDGRQTRRGVDAETGELSPMDTLPGFGAEEAVEIEMLADGLAQALADGEAPRLVLTDGGGDPIWEAELPVVVHRSASWNDRVVVASRRWGARGVLLVLDAATGRVLDRAAGFRGLGEMQVAGELLIAETASGLAAVRLDTFGPPEMASTSVEQAVAGILAELAVEGTSLRPQSVREELQELGPEALPVLAREIPRASPDLLGLIADLVSAGGYRPAADALAVRAGELIDGPGSEPDDDEWERQALVSRLIRTVAAVAGPEQTPILERFLDLPSHRDLLLEVLAALGRVAPSRAVAALERLRAHYGGGSWYRPPIAGPWLEAAAVEVDAGAVENLWSTAWEDPLLVRRMQAAVAASDGVAWVAFFDSQFGSQDLWAAPLADDGAAGAALFVGTVPPPTYVEDEEPRVEFLEADLRAGSLEVGYPVGRSLTVRLEDLQADRDGDGLSDRFERRLGLDPGSRDSDGDGLPDPRDSAPHGGGRAPETRDEAAFLGLHELLRLASAAESDADDDGGEPAASRGESAGPDLAFLTGVPSLEWPGPGATFVEERDESCRQWSYRRAGTPPRPLGADEVAVELVFSCAEGGESWETVMTYVVREADGAWVVSEIGEG